MPDEKGEHRYTEFNKIVYVLNNLALTHFGRFPIYAGDSIQRYDREFDFIYEGVRPVGAYEGPLHFPH